MQHINLVPHWNENISMYSFLTPEKNHNFFRRLHGKIHQKSIEFLYNAKKQNAPASSFTIPMMVHNKAQKIAYKVFKLKDDKLTFEFSPQELEFDKWMIARDCTYDKGEGKIWVGDDDSNKKYQSTPRLHTFHCFRKYEDAIKYKKLVEFQRPHVIKSDFVIMPVEIDTSVLSQFEIIYLPYLNCAIFGVNTTLMYVDSNNIII